MNVRRHIPLQFGTLLLLSFCAQVATAARVCIEIGTVRKDGAAITATMHNIETIDVPREDQPDFVDRAFKFNLHVVEVLYGTGIKPGDVIPIDASFGNYACVWEGGSETHGYGAYGGPLTKPPEGTKLIAYLQPPEKDRRDLYFYPGSALVLDSFDDPRVDMWRHIAKLWAMPTSPALVKALIKGSRSDNIEYQKFCVGTLIENRDENGWMLAGFHAIELKGATTRAELDTILWDIFTRSSTPLEIILDCDRSFSGLDQKYRNVWQLHPLRHEMITQAIKRHVANPQTTDWQKVGWAMPSLTECPARADRTRELILQLIKSPDSAAPSNNTLLGFSRPDSALIYLPAIYTPNATSTSAQKLNEKIVHDLTGLTDNPKLATLAVNGLGSLAREYAQIGEQNSMLLKLIETADKPIPGEQDIDADARRGLCKSKPKEIEELAGRARRAIGNTKLPPRLTWPFADQVGHEVYVVSRGLGTPPGIWIDAKSPMGDTTQSIDYWIAIGTLKKYDLPHFELKPGQTFGQGLPIPPGTRAEDVAVRYVLENISWITVPRTP